MYRMQGRNGGGQGRHNSPGAESLRGAHHGGGREMTAGDEKKSQQCHKYLLQYSTLLQKDLRFEHRGDKLASCPRAPSNLVTPLIECLVRTTSHGTLRPFNSFLILLNLEKDLSPEQLVVIKLRNKALRGCIN